LKIIKIAIGLSLNAIRDRKWLIQACSVKLDEGVKVGMEWVMSIVKK
jgi:hypothetical protein